MAQSYTWENGRQLKTLTNSKGTWTYTYDADGMRTGRTNGTTTYEYIYAGDKLVRMVKNGEVVDFGYAGNQLATMTYDGVTYYYVLNGQGDVVALTDSTGTMIIGYHYSAYGCPVLLKTDYNAYNDLKYLNPFLYRGYAYDIESTLYYLQSRYYDPELGRFINADALVSTGQGILGNNMFAYCNNNPVCWKDDIGYEPEKVLDDGSVEVSPDEDELGFGGGGGKGGFDPYQTAIDSNSCPNPYGRHGGPKHTGLIESLRLLFDELGFDVSSKEKRVSIPGEDKYRYPDLTVDTGKETIYVQVGKSKANGDPIAREQRAIDDLRKTGNMVWFFPYDD